MFNLSEIRVNDASLDEIFEVVTAGSTMFATAAKNTASHTWNEASYTELAIGAAVGVGIVGLGVATAIYAPPAVTLCLAATTVLPVLVPIGSNVIISTIANAYNEFYHPEVKMAGDANYHTNMN
jgi:hypothetical protein